MFFSDSTTVIALYFSESDDLFLFKLTIFNNIQLQCTGFELTTRDSYFTILVEVFVLKPANKYQIIRKCYSLKSILIDAAQHYPFFIK